MFTHQVLRPMTANGPRQPGELVDASKWRNTKKLVDMRYLERLPVPLDETTQQPITAIPGKVKDSPSNGSVNQIQQGLSEDFPGRAVLHAAGFTTIEEVRAINVLTDIKGIRKALAAQIHTALAQ